MTQNFYVLGIETSCDETAAAVVDVAERRLLSNVVYSQIKEHADYGGVVPELASRAHQQRLPGLVQQAMAQAQLSFADLNGVAATSGPGLLGGLLVGYNFAKSVAMAAEKPLYATNHLEGHALTAQLSDGVAFPYLLLLVSGGHCQFIHVKGLGDYTTLGGTLDDAVGECFDKVAKMMGLPYPGGPNVEKCAKKGNSRAFVLPVPLRHDAVNFSFSGLKTAMRQLIISQEQPLTAQVMADLSASFQQTVSEILVLKSKNALQQSGASRFVLAGGVAANSLLRGCLEELCVGENVAFFAPPIGLCTDNAVMIAYAGGLHLQRGDTTPLDKPAQPRWSLDTLAGVSAGDIR